LPDARLQEKLNFGVQEHRAGRLQKARQVYKKILKARPQYVDALHMLGLLEHQSGDNETAISLLTRATREGPASAELFTNLGSALQAKGDVNEAINAYRKAIGINPGFALAYNNLGNALRATGEVDAALDAFRQATRIAPDFALAYYNLGDLLHAQGQYGEAFARMKCALALKPDFAGTCNSLATMLMEQGEIAGASDMFERTLRLDSNNTSARHMLAALTGQTTATAPPGYVTGLFDGCAAYFDRQLVDELGYRVPENLHRMVLQLVGPDRKGLDVMDLGCGTGLCGPLFRDMAGTLVGVDLSPGMLARASQRKLYDRLVTADLTKALGTCEDAYDLILAADVFIYVGRLDQVFEAISAALRPGGLFAFSIEAEEGDSDFVLRHTGRYAHTISYIIRLAEAVGLREVHLEESMLRTDKGQPVDGYLVVLGKPVE
jgi:predicted TPR repeat methyltransferase